MMLINFTIVTCYYQFPAIIASVNSTTAFTMTWCSTHWSTWTGCKMLKIQVIWQSQFLICSRGCWGCLQFIKFQIQGCFGDLRNDMSDLFWEKWFYILKKNGKINEQVDKKISVIRIKIYGSLDRIHILYPI